VAPVIVTLFGLILAYLYDRGRRYNYLADRWNTLMNMNINEWEFFDEEKTLNYKSLDLPKLIKYNQHARMYWGAVEDIVRNDYPFERLLRLETFVDAYSDTIRDCIRLHHPWLNDNIETLFTYRKFRRHLTRKFPQELAAVRLNLDVQKIQRWTLRGCRARTRLP